jgi:hypothetical protein
MGILEMVYKDIKKSRSVNLSSKLNNDLETLCEHLGINIHSYMINELAKAVQRDLLSFSSKKQMEEMVIKLMKIAETE